MTPREVKAIFQQADQKRREADAASDAMAAVLLQAMRKILPEGTVIELNRRPVPEYLLHVRTLSGNDRGTRTFRVVNVVAVDVDPTRPELSKWMCDAVPVSERTGKDMKGSTHSRSSDTVRLHGDVGYLGIDESIEASRDRLVSMVAANA
ncbi:hypothetical protein AB4Y45_34600 [Paraburkholderia sp. EG287A]|uniref:hypothetical protein n=1 Tax=Paraburkholderia sp. EG287A TaxID=3237012 RepID=UPI0034D25097